MTQCSVNLDNTKTAEDEGHRDHFGDAVQYQGSCCDKYSLEEWNWWNIIA